MLDYLRALLVVRVKTERGSSAVEYGLIVAGVALACFVAFQAFGFTLGVVFEHQHDQLEKCHGMGC
jgi:Flp pilus assembly pilin Flp